MACQTNLPTFYQLGVYYIRTDKIIAVRLGSPKKEEDQWTIAVLYAGAPLLKSITYPVDTREEADRIITKLTHYSPLLEVDEASQEDF